MLDSTLSVDNTSGDWSKMLFDLAPVIFVVLDDEMTVIRINEKGAKALELDGSAIVGKNWIEYFVPHDDREAQRQVLQDVLLGTEESPEAYESRIVSSSGNQKTIWWSIRRITSEKGFELLCSGEDITDRINAEQALRESEAKARAIVETTVDAVITIDERGIIESFNSAAERIFAYTADEVIGRNVKVLMPPPYNEEHDGYMRSYRESGRRKIIGIGREVVGRRKDGSTFPMDLSVSEVDLGDRRIFTGVVRDITERRLLEQEILRISDQERRRIGQDLHDGLGQMLTGTALIARNLTQKLKSEGRPEAEELAEITNFIKEADEYARGLAKGLVPVELAENGLPAALRQLCYNVERLFPVRSTFNYAGTITNLDSTVGTHLYRIAQEAVNNAVKHGRARKITLTLSGGSRQLRLRIKDDGIGFPDEMPEEHGMGVQIMHYRARIIGATLEIWRDPAGGTVVTCSMPFKIAALSSAVRNENVL